MRTSPITEAMQMAHDFGHMTPDAARRRPGACAFSVPAGSPGDVPRLGTSWPVRGVAGGGVEPPTFRFPAAPGTSDGVAPGS